MVSAIDSNVTNQAASTTAQKTTATDKVSNSAVLTDTYASQRSSTSPSISTLSIQLAASATRAEERDKSLTQKELGDKGRKILDEIMGNTWFANKKVNDSEVPNTTDPALLARAKQATDHINGVLVNGQRTKNPFEGLSREQLANIAYDESGTFTVNERSAAQMEAYSQEEAWSEKVVAKMMNEYATTGKMTNFFSEALAHFNELPAIEKAQARSGYANDLQKKIELDFNYLQEIKDFEKARDAGTSSSSLLEILLKQSET